MLGNTWDLIILKLHHSFRPSGKHIVRVTSFLVKHINVYSQQTFTTTHKNKPESTQLKSFLSHFGLAT
jgi:hypothetical protein